MTKYKLLLCDPAWKYNDKAASGNRGAEFKYPCLTLQQLINMKNYVDSIGEDDCVLYMWTTGPMMPDAIELMSAWGFKYKTVAFTWIKTNKNPIYADPLHQTYLQTIKVGDTICTSGDFLSMGHHTRGNAEFVLLGVKGKGIKRINASVRSTIISPICKHSQKPTDVHKRLEMLYGDVSRIEMFAREPRDGWDVMGDEVGLHIDV